MALVTTTEYALFLEQIKHDIQMARQRAHLAVNQELIFLYWRIGSEIIRRKQELGWGAEVVNLLAADLKHAFPEMKGLSSRNLVYMQTLASRFSREEFTQQGVARLPWGHITHLLDKVKDQSTMGWYIQKVIEYGWSRNILLTHVSNQSHLKLGKCQTNFSITLPPPHSDLAQEIIKSEYNFSFLGLTERISERILEDSLISHIKDFLLELGSGFAYLGNQYRITVGQEEFVLDLLFYHTQLHAYTIVELKLGKFKPEYLGQLNFYLTAVDRTLKSPQDNPTIGLLLCQQADQVVVEYALSTAQNPMGVAQYHIVTKKLPKKYAEFLPSTEQFQRLLDQFKQKTMSF